MMKTLTLTSSSDENLRIIPQQSKLSNIQEILNINNNDSNENTITDTPRLVSKNLT